jgi:hypothetical protein
MIAFVLDRDLAAGKEAPAMTDFAIAPADLKRQLRRNLVNTVAILAGTEGLVGVKRRGPRG